MSARRLIRWGLISISALSLAGYLVFQVLLDCGPPAADQSQQKCRPEPGKSPAGIERPRHGVVLTLRLTDDGELVDRCEQTDVFYELNWNRQIDPSGHYNIKVTPGAQPLPKFVVVYVHGWKNDARTDMGDHPRFKDLITKLADQHKGKKQVVGIYVSWSAAWRVPILEHLTFWGRMRAADRITQSGTLTKFISALQSILAKDRDSENQLVLKNQLVVIGHSFGARMVYSATIQNLLHSVQQEHPGRSEGEYGLVRGSADATILLNPAFEASLFTAVDAIFRQEEQFKPNQPPVLLSISTDNDRATGWAFPIGQRLFLRSRMERTTLGYYRPYQTHALRRTTRDECLGPAANNFRLSEKFYLVDFCTSPLPPRSLQPYNPFMVIQTDKSIIDGHSGIWEADFSRWLFELVKELGERHEEAPKSLPGT